LFPGSGQASLKAASEFEARVFREHDDVEILSAPGKSLARYFPEVVALVAGERVSFILDGELILLIGICCPSMRSRRGFTPPRAS
jgi:hypothetical protein